MRCHSNQWPCSYFLLCLAFSRHYLKTGKSTLKVYIFWEGHKNLKKTLTWFWWKVEDFFSNLATFSQFMNFNMQYGLSCIQRFPEIMIHHNVLIPLETSMFTPEQGNMTISGPAEHRGTVGSSHFDQSCFV